MPGSQTALNQEHHRNTGCIGRPTMTRDYRPSGPDSTVRADVPDRGQGLGPS